MNVDRLKGEIKKRGDTVVELAKALDVHPVSLYRKINEKKIALREAKIIVKRYELTAQEVMDIFFCD